MSDDQPRFIGVFKGVGKSYVMTDAPGFTFSHRYLGTGTWGVDERGHLYHLCNETGRSEYKGFVWVLDKTRIVRNPGDDE